jgi:LPXTG-site transpeptidase (sortase) family protein
MRRTALVLGTALALGAGAGFFVHTGMAGDEGAPPPRPSATTTRTTKVEGQVRSAGRLDSQRAPRTSPPSLWIPRLHLKSRIFASSRLDKGPAWWPITGRPGGGDTIAVAGHRTTHSRPFYFLERLQRGDRIQVSYLGRRYVYRVSRSRVIPSTNLHIADAVGHERVLLTACTPRGSAQFRLVVEALPESGEHTSRPYRSSAPTMNNPALGGTRR